MFLKWNLHVLVIAYLRVDPGEQNAGGSLAALTPLRDRALTSFRQTIREL